MFFRNKLAIKYVLSLVWPYETDMVAWNTCNSLIFVEVVVLKKKFLQVSVFLCIVNPINGVVVKPKNEGKLIPLMNPTNLQFLT